MQASYHTNTDQTRLAMMRWDQDKATGSGPFTDPMDPIVHNYGRTIEHAAMMLASCSADWAEHATAIGAPVHVTRLALAEDVAQVALEEGMQPHEAWAEWLDRLGGYANIGPYARAYMVGLGF